jgi:hypothetical protein
VGKLLVVSEDADFIDRLRQIEYEITFTEDEGIDAVLFDVDADSSLFAPLIR